MKRSPFASAFVAALVLVLALLPVLVPNAAILTYAIFTLMFVAIASAWNILAGYSGYVSLGHAAFYGIGAYALALFAKWWDIQTGGYATFLDVVLAGFVAALFAVPIGLISLRTRKHSFVVITIAFLFLLQLLAFNLNSLTGGSAGLPLPAPPWSGFFYSVPFYYFAFLLAVVTVAVSTWVRHAKLGLGLLAIRDDEDRALGFGVPTGVYKLFAFVLAAFFIGIAGAFDGYFSSYIYPQFAFNPVLDVTMAAMTFFGGLGTVAGPVVGAIVLEPVEQLLAVQYADLALVLFGAVFLVVMAFLPRGVMPSITDGLRRLQAQRAVAVHAEADVPLAKGAQDSP